MDDGFIHGHLERYRFFNSNKDVLHYFKRYFLDLRYMDNLFYRVWYGLLHRDRDFLDNRNDYSFRYRNMNWYWVWDGDQDRLPNLEFHVLRQRDDYFFVMFDRFWAFFVDVLMDGV